ncbi:MAG: cytochrome C [Methylococcaceae bacterium]|nr:cytochrome C [Methylococcaceae bacterium]
MNQRIALLALLAALPLGSATASGGSGRAPLDPTYVGECGSCHIPYPPQLLDAASWQALLGQLDRHFQVDATVEPPTLEQIRIYLAAHARRKPSGAPVLRVSETAWFRHEHDDITVAQWGRVKSKSNCAACHPRAAEGRYSEHEIKLP